MKNLIAVLLAAGLSASPAGAETDNVRLCHIANAGFLIEGKSGSVLVDAVRLHPYQDFPLASEGLASAIVRGEGRFADVKLALATHYHADHFEAAATRAHLDNMPDLSYVLPPQASDLLEGDKSRITVTLPDWESGGTEFTFGDIAVKVFRVSHGADRPIDNLGFKVTVDGISFFHPGDIFTDREQLTKAGLSNEKVDVLMVPFWFGMDDDEQMDALTNALDWRIAVPMHFQDGEPEWSKKHGGMAAIRANAMETFENAVELQDEMACMQVVPE